jgi:hypothetical protein
MISSIAGKADSGRDSGALLNRSVVQPQDKPDAGRWHERDGKHPGGRSLRATKSPLRLFAQQFLEIRARIE